MGSIKPPEHAGLKPNKGVKNCTRHRVAQVFFLQKNPAADLAAADIKTTDWGLFTYRKTFVCAQNQAANN